jgi:hypothetical protein
MNHGWWWHLWNDPVSENPWSMLGLVIIVAAILAVLWWVAGLRDRKRRRDVNAIIERLERDRSIERSRGEDPR